MTCFGVLIKTQRKKRTTQLGLKRWFFILYIINNSLFLPPYEPALQIQSKSYKVDFKTACTWDLLDWFVLNSEYFCRLVRQVRNLMYSSLT